MLLGANNNRFAVINYSYFIDVYILQKKKSAKKAEHTASKLSLYTFIYVYRLNLNPINESKQRDYLAFDCFSLPLICY